MLDTSQGKIFLANQRGHIETDWFRSYTTFNFGNFQDLHKEPFGNLYVLNDDTLAAGREMSFIAEEDSFIILLPVVGAVAYKDNAEEPGIVKAGEIVSFSIASSQHIQFSNPFEEGLINYLHIWLKRRVEPDMYSQTFVFDIDVNKNQLVPLFDVEKALQTHQPNRYYLGKFMGREEIIHKLSTPGNGVFVFVLEGAFEVQYRLLEARDGLALWNVSEIEIEALSNDAIILLVELPVTNT